VHDFEHVAEVVLACWLLINILGVALVATGLARQYARAAQERREEQAGEVAFDPALTVTE
jgi:hypothetical protein